MIAKGDYDEKKIVNIYNDFCYKRYACAGSVCGG